MGPILALTLLGGVLHSREQRILCSISALSFVLGNLREENTSNRCQFAQTLFPSWGKGKKVENSQQLRPFLSPVMRFSTQVLEGGAGLSGLGCAGGVRTPEGGGERRAADFQSYLFDTRAEWWPLPGARS